MTDKTNLNENIDVTSLTLQELYDRHLECPINNLNSYVMLDSLFDDGQYVENRVNDKYVALGFIDGVPVRCEYKLGDVFITIHTLLIEEVCSYRSLFFTLPERLSDEQYFSKMIYCRNGIWIVDFFYRSAG